MTAATETPSTGTQFVTFWVAGHLLGIPARKVLEVLGHQVITAVPLSPPAVAGLTNLRGEVVTVLDLRHRLGLGQRPSGEQPMSVIVASDDGAVSLLVDEVGDVVDVAHRSFEEPPSTLSEYLSELIMGAYKLDVTLLLSLDVGRVVDVRAGSPAQRVSRTRDTQALGASPS
jgi:purine-binding chemotaxis protein CheW